MTPEESRALPVRHIGAALAEAWRRQRDLVPDNNDASRSGCGCQGLICLRISIALAGVQRGGRSSRGLGLAITCSQRYGACATRQR